MWKAPTSASVLEKLRSWLGNIGSGAGGITLDHNEVAVLVSKTQLSYLDLEAFDQYAKNCFAVWQRGDTACREIRELSAKLQSIIEAIRNDGLDPRWNPERDALCGLTAGGEGGGDTKWAILIDNKGADGLVYQLHQRGYKIVKDAS